MELDGTLVTIKLGRDMKSKVDALAHRYVRINTKRRKLRYQRFHLLKRRGSNTSGVTEVSRNTGEKEDAKSPPPILVKKEKRDLKFTFILVEM